MSAHTDDQRPWRWQGPAPAGPPVHAGCGRRHRPFTKCPKPDSSTPVAGETPEPDNGDDQDLQDPAVTRQR